MASSSLEDWGFILRSNNMGTVIWEKKMLDHSQILLFESRNQNYTFKHKYSSTEKPMIVSYKLHKAISDYVEKELYWR
jgi:hypothetical protein